MKIFYAHILCIAFVLFVPYANANDSTARVGVGGITLLKSDEIQMRSEVLEVSTSLIRVHYEFINESHKDVKATIAFPMPSYTSPNPYVDRPYNKPMRSFSTHIDGREIPTALDRRATKKSVDITKQLREVGLTENQIFETFALCEEPGEEPDYCGLTTHQIDALKKNNIGYWQVDETALWEYVFPAKKVVAVLHEYSPNVGSSYFVPYQSGRPMWEDRSAESVNAEKISADCEGNDNDAVLKRVKALAKNGAHSVFVGVQEVEYILHTGKNWNGPIADFKLRLKKSNPDQIISVCFPGKPKRIDNLTFEFSQKNYIPHDDLLVVFYTVTPTDAY